MKKPRSDNNTMRTVYSHTFAAKSRLCRNRIQIIFCMYVEISVDNVINILVLKIQILINVFLYFNFSDRNGNVCRQPFLSSLLNTQIHMSMKLWRLNFSLAVISSVVNMTSEKYYLQLSNISEYKL